MKGTRAAVAADGDGGLAIFGVALFLLVGAILTDLRAKQLLPWGPDRPETAP